MKRFHSTELAILGDSSGSMHNILAVVLSKSTQSISICLYLVLQSLKFGSLLFTLQKLSKNSYFLKKIDLVLQA